MAPDSTSLSKDGGDRTVPSDLLHRSHAGWLAGTWLDMEKNLAYQHALAVTEVRLTKQGKAWRLMVKGTRNGNAVVSYEHIEGFSQALEWLVFNASAGQMHFSPDKWPITSIR